MGPRLSCAILVGLSVLAVACQTSSLPTSPTTPVTAIATPAVATPPGPPLSGHSRTFVFDRDAGSPVQNYTRQSRFVLYNTGAFVLEYTGLGLAYRGTYREAAGAIVFEWEGWSTAGPWGATGTLDGDTLTVRYNLVMLLTDFDDAVYRRQ